MSHEELEEMGPIDLVVIEFPNSEPKGEAAPLLIDLVDRGIIRILDLTFVRKAEDGTVSVVELSDFDGDRADLRVFDGASSGLLGGEDVASAGEALQPGSAAALLLFENRWAAPFATALKRAGGQLAAFERIPVQAVLASLEAAEAHA